MEQAFSPASKPPSSSRALCRVSLAFAVMTGLLPSPVHAQNYGPNLLSVGSMQSVTTSYVPWAGVDDKGNIHGLDGKQISVDDFGNIGSHAFGPSVAVADLNGDGKPDLVVADSRGFFWFYPNTGTPQKPVFTQGEVMPIWLGEERTHWDTEGYDSVVPRLQVLDLDHSGKLDIVAGMFSGKLFLVPNVGSSTQPAFKPTYDRDNLLINTHRKGLLWCNYLSPFFTNAFGTPNTYDLIMGEGTYSANSIYLLHNQNTGGVPAFDEDHLEKIIPGMGLEQLTPVVLDWNNDGKPDILSGDRTGGITLYLNNSTDTNHPTFAPGVPVKIAGMAKLGNATTLAIGDLTGNHLPNLLIGVDDGTILYALNTGTLGSPVFNTPATPLKGVFPPTYHCVVSRTWNKGQVYGTPYEVLQCVNPQLEPGFTFPEGEKTQYALKFSVWPVKPNYFPTRYYTPVEDFWREHVIAASQGLSLQVNKRYRVHFWAKAVGNVSDFRYSLAAAPPRPGVAFHSKDIINPISAGSDWTEESSDVEVDNPDDPTVKAWGYSFEFRFTGQSTLYIDDVEIQEED